MVRDGFGDDSGAKLIEQRGVDFTPAEDFLQTLKAAGASEAFLNALRGAKPPEPASAKKPINRGRFSPCWWAKCSVIREVSGIGPVRSASMLGSRASHFLDMFNASRFSVERSRQDLPREQCG